MQIQYKKSNDYSNYKQRCVIIINNHIYFFISSNEKEIINIDSIVLSEITVNKSLSIFVLEIIGAIIPIEIIAIDKLINPSEINLL